MNISVNGTDRSFEAGIDVRQLLDIIGVESATVVVEFNRGILAQDEYAGTVLKEGDQLEIIQFVGGG